MKSLIGVYPASKKDGTAYYRASITFNNKHISLGSFQTDSEAHMAYEEANIIIHNSNYDMEDYKKDIHILSFHKWVVLINFRDNGIYFKNPIYLKKHYFIYYMNFNLLLKFDVDDLFYYSNHKIMKRGGYLFVSDYGMQINILSRYGIKNFAVAGKDYRFVNNDSTDYRYGNIEIINKYHGVSKVMKNGIPSYISKIHVNGDTIVGKYVTENEAAAAYNKAADILLEKGVRKNFIKNYILDLNSEQYSALYNKVKINYKITDRQN